MAKQFSVFVNVGGRVAPSFTNAINTVQGKLDGLNRHMLKRAADAKAAMKGIGESMKAAAAMAAGGGLAFSCKHAFGDGAELAHEIQGLRNAGRSAHEIAEGIKAATDAISELPTSTMVNGIKLLNETTGAFGDYHHALENLTFNSKLADVLKNTVHVEDPTHALGSMIKALEIRGSASNPETYRREAEKLTQAMTFFGGRLKPEDIYTFASNAQVGIRQLNERFLTRIAPSMIQELGGDKVGTGLTAFRTIISGRKISDNAQAAEWVKLGLVNKNMLIKNKMGDVKGWKEGAVENTRGAYQDPLQWMEDTILPKLQKRGVDLTDPIKLGAALNTLFKNTKANAFVAAISTVVDRARLKKDEALINQVLSVNENYNSSLLNDPKFAQLAIKSSLTNIGAALTLPLMKPVAQMLIAIARGINQVSAALMRNPKAAKIVAGIAAALTTLAAVRIASFLLGVTGLARALGFLALAAPLGLASRLLTIASAVRALAVASAIGAVGRLRALAAGIIALGAVGGVRGVLAALAGSFVALGRAILMLPVTLLRGAFVGIAAVLSPIGVSVAAVTVALTALGLWVYNNLSGLGTFFKSFGDAFMKALGPENAQNVQTIVGYLKQAWQWVNNLLGPLDESGAKWKAWGEWAGQGAAAVVTALTGLPEKIGAVARQGYDALVNFDWKKAGGELVDKIIAGISGATGALVDALKAAVGSAWRSALSAVGLGGTTPAPGAPAVDGHRARGGPVSAGKTYLVGEKGPELFRPAGSGSITSHSNLNNLAERMNGPKGEPGGGGKSWYDAVMRAEGTSGRDPYNTVLGYGRYGSPSKPLTDMNLREAYQFGRSVRARHGSSSALGAFQIVGRTMKDAMKATGLGWDDKFSPENQRTMAGWIRKTQGFGAWEGFKRHPGELAAARAGGSTVDPIAGPSSVAVGKIIRDAQEGAAKHAASGGGAHGGGGGRHAGLASRVTALADHAQATVKASKSRSKSSSRDGSGGIVVNLTVNSTGGDANEIASTVRREMRMILAEYESAQNGSLND
ncbi:hypothetical protein GOFOIKOB_4872 [Methylobacterium tardum]|uniref:Uncharacterized protein n=1 Tax=Methylobacterium tardum TaxID=374432 RepID=A0AA37TJV7_9HYPH|nr:hypothetical protein [Methylobacterium tardum]GJE51808.1 hypothetical protein GOFOIKOB_4872 [Methylobacterium tardum]GLS72334.1 hypothetical protein GCM10007890_43470 [Methylobacterium tardum]